MVDHASPGPQDLKYWILFEWWTANIRTTGTISETQPATLMGTMLLLISVISQCDHAPVEALKTSLAAPKGGLSP